jgi:hypothetical protein
MRNGAAGADGTLSTYSSKNSRQIASGLVAFAVLDTDPIRSQSQAGADLNRTRSVILAAKRWTPEQRKLLGALLTERREELDPRYYVREVFAPERGINLRTAADLENGRPRNFTPLTLRDVVAPAYAVTYESLLDAADGGDLLALPGSPPHRPPRNVRPLRRPEPGTPATPASLPGFVTEEMRVRSAPGAVAIALELRKLALRGVAEPAGSDLFGPGEDADLWDRAARKGMPLDERVWLLAAFRQHGRPGARGCRLSRRQGPGPCRAVAE